MRNISLQPQMISSIYEKSNPTTPFRPQSSQLEERGFTKKVHKKIMTTQFSPQQKSKHRHTDEVVDSIINYSEEEETDYLKCFTKISLDKAKSINTIRNKANKSTNNSFIKSKCDYTPSRAPNTPKITKKTQEKNSKKHKKTADITPERFTKKKPIHSTLRDQQFIRSLQEYIKQLTYKKPFEPRKTVSTKNKNKKILLANFSEGLRNLQQQHRREVVLLKMQIKQMNKKSKVLNNKMNQINEQIIGLKVKLRHQIQQRKRFESLFISMKREMERAEDRYGCGQLLSYEGSVNEGYCESQQFMQSPRYNVSKFNDSILESVGKSKMKRKSQELLEYIYQTK